MDDPQAIVENHDKNKEHEPLLVSPGDQTAGIVATRQPVLKRMNLIGQGLSRMSQDLGESMHTSTTTASTRLSGLSQKSNGENSPPRSSLKPVLPPNIPPPKQRSIGIQLNSPALPLKQPSFGSKTSMSTGGCTNHGAQSAAHRAESPSLSLAGTETEQDFEYDYYEPNIPGSFLNPDWFRGGGFGELLSEIDIDEIIGDSELMNTPTHSPQPERPTAEKQDGGGGGEKGISVSTQFFAPLRPVRAETLSFAGTGLGWNTTATSTDGNKSFMNP